MSMDDLIKLVKILAYTTSANDNEALNACRRANTLMKSMNLTWEQLIKDKTIVVNEIISNEVIPAAPTTSAASSNTASFKTGNYEVELMLQVCMSRTNFARMNPTGQAFIKSLNDWYQRNHSLTDKQKEALKNWYNRI